MGRLHMEILPNINDQSVCLSTASVQCHCSYTTNEEASDEQVDQAVNSEAI